MTRWPPTCTCPTHSSTVSSCASSASKTAFSSGFPFLLGPRFSSLPESHRLASHRPLQPSLPAHGLLQKQSHRVFSCIRTRFCYNYPVLCESPPHTDGDTDIISSRHAPRGNHPAAVRSLCPSGRKEL